MDKKLKLIKDEEEQKSILKLCELGVITNKKYYMNLQYLIIKIKKMKK